MVAEPDPACVMVSPTFGWRHDGYVTLLADALARQGCRVARRWDFSPLRVRPGAGRAASVVHMHWLHTYSRGRGSAWPALKAARLRRQLAALDRDAVPLVWTAHNLAAHEGGRSALDRELSARVAQAARAIIVHSRAAHDLVVQHFALDARRVHVVPHPNYVGIYPNGISREEARRRAGIAGEEFVLLFFGKIRPYKGLADLIAALRRVPQLRLRLRIVGRVLQRGYRDEVRRLAASDPRVELLSAHVPDAEIQNHMNSADAVVLPYREVLSSGAALLAMSFARCCIAPRVGMLVDVFADDGVFHYEPHDVDGLARAIAAACAERASLPTRGRANLRRAEPWTWAAAAEATRRLYRQLVVAG